MQAGEASAADFLVISGLVVWPRALITQHLSEGVFERVREPASSVSWDELFRLSHRPVSPDDLSLSLDLWKSVGDAVESGKKGANGRSAAEMGTPEEAERVRLADQVLWLGSLLPRLLTTPNGSQWLPTAPYDYKHTLLLASNDSH